MAKIIAKTTLPGESIDFAGMTFTYYFPAIDVDERKKHFVPTNGNSACGALV